MTGRERLDALEKPKESELFLKKAQEVARTGHWRIDIPGNRIEWSEETCRIFGVSSGSPVTLETFYSLVHPADSTTVKGAGRKPSGESPFSSVTGSSAEMRPAGWRSGGKWSPILEESQSPAWGP